MYFLERPVSVCRLGMTVWGRKNVKKNIKKEKGKRKKSFELKILKVLRMWQIVFPILFLFSHLGIS